MLTQETLKQHLHYDPETGVFTRLKSAAHNAAAGFVHKTLGYRYIGVCGKQYPEHRLAVFYMTGVWPEAPVDHIDGVRHNNAWANLRVASVQINQQNLHTAQRNNRLGVLGVSYLHNRRGSKKYVAQLFTSGKRVHCSYHNTPEEAHAAYIAAKRKYHEGNTL